MSPTTTNNNSFEALSFGDDEDSQPELQDESEPKANDNKSAKPLVLQFDPSLSVEENVMKMMGMIGKISDEIVDLNTRIKKQGEKIKEHGEKIKEHGEKIKEHGEKIKELEKANKVQKIWNMKIEHEIQNSQLLITTLTGGILDMANKL